MSKRRCRHPDPEYAGNRGYYHAFWCRICGALGTLGDDEFRRLYFKGKSLNGARKWHHPTEADDE